MIDLHLVLITPEIPANTGNIVRLCACTGVHLHLVEPLGFFLDDRATRRAGLDYWKNCDLKTHLTFEQIQDLLPDSRCHYLSARARQSFFEHQVKPGDILVLGPESSGLSAEFLSKGDRKKDLCTVPMPGTGRSLNLSTTAGIVIYEALRQLGHLATEQNRE